MTNEIDFTSDIISVEDMTNRVEELREERDDYTYTNADGQETMINGPAQWAIDNANDAHELQTLESALEEMAGNGGNHQWEGTWYPDYLTAESHFETAMDELIDDIGEIPKDLPSYLTVVIDYNALRMDYTSIQIAGHDFLYR